MGSKSGKLTKLHMKEWAQKYLYTALHLDGITYDQNSGECSTQMECFSEEADDFQSIPNPDLTNPNCWRHLIEAADKHCYPPYDYLFFMDSWAGQRNHALLSDMRYHHVDEIMIPEGLTRKLQPLDVYFNRQNKKFVKRISEELDLYSEKDEVIRREGIVKMHALIYIQFSSPKYQDMLLYTWHNTDPKFDNSE